MNGGDFELELSLSWRQGSSFALAARFLRPDSNEEYQPPDAAELVFDPEPFRALEQSPAEYGAALTKLLFADQGVRDTFVKARAAALQQRLPLRVRLAVGPDARALGSLRWELLRDPEKDEPLLVQPDVLFSRYLASLDWRPVATRPRGELRALVVVANPSDLASYAPGGRALSPIDAPAEVARAREALRGFRVEALADPGTATLDRIGERLRTGFDVLYLVCHGALVEDAPRLWLEDERGRTARVAGSELIARVQDATQRPRLVLLASCESAGTGAIADDGALSALGPRLAQAGVPAVLAMNGRVSMRSLALFLPAFFEELASDGRVDRAVAVARGRVRGEPDWWMPALFMRLRNGRLWYEQGFSPDAGGFDRWDALLSEIETGTCIPILGPDLTEEVLGSFREVASRLADRYGFPLEPHGREDLAQVAQYLAYRQDRAFPRTQLGEVLKRHVREKFRSDLPQELLARPPRDVTLDDLVSAAGEAVRRTSEGKDVHSRLARMPFKLYVTANRDNLLRDALASTEYLPGKKKEPQVAIVRWKEKGWPRGLPDPAGLEPTEERPVVLHLFGNLRYPDTLVLSEDDYFDFLLALSRAVHPPIPENLQLADSGRLFLGFQVEDWDFRILYRAIRQEGSAAGEDRMRVAVQLNPGEDRILEPIGARKYLECYFQRGHTFVYWGSADAFMADLERRWREP